MTITERIAALKALNSVLESLQDSMTWMMSDDGNEPTSDDWRYEEFLGKKLLLPMLEKLADKI